MSLKDVLPDPVVLLGLAPEELAGALIAYLNSLPLNERRSINRYNFSLRHTVSDYPLEHQDQISRALMEAWVWLEHEGFLAPKPGQQGEWVFITRRGSQMLSAQDVEAYRKANLLPRQLLHGSIAGSVWGAFVRGAYETAVFEAFKQVEVAVRTAGGFPNDKYGTTLMRMAFATNTGPLSDKSALPAEQEALASLFAGAIGSYKNPNSHRSVTIDAVQAVEMIILASHLLGIIDKRIPDQAGE
jgi:uncharacterized protein (TIGR02391 family)